MADLFQSHYDLGSLRRGVEDGETLWALLAEDGSITVVPDPTESEVQSAQAALAKVDEEDADSPETKALARTAAFPVVPQVEEEEEEAPAPKERAEAK